MNNERDWVFSIVALVFIFIAVVCFANAINKVECGVVANKYYTAGYSSGELNYNVGHYHVEPPRYFVQLEYKGKKFWFEATVDEYKERSLANGLSGDICFRGFSKSPYEGDDILDAMRIQERL